MNSSSLAYTGHNLRSRSYESERDLEQMRALLMEGRSRAGDWRFFHVGDLMWNFFMITCHLRTEQHVRLWHDAGKLVGYAILGEDPLWECQVLPEHAYSGIEIEALAWAETRLAELRRREAPRWSGQLVAVVRQDDAERIVFLEKHGFRNREHGEVNLLRSLSVPLPEPALPAGYQLRAIIDPRDVPDRAALEREVWSPWSVGNVTSHDYARLMRLPGYNRQLDLVTVAPNGVIAASVNGWTDPVNRVGDFGPVGARAAYRRRGLTRAALLEGMRRMQALGMDRVVISTQVTNTAARALYESIGFGIVNRTLEYAKAI